jgi:hypothetical protein
MSEHDTRMANEIRERGENVAGWSPLRLLVAGLASLLTGLLAAGSWVVGQAQYLEDYCSTRAPEPSAPTPEALDGRPAYLDGAMTVRCEYHDLPTVLVTDPLPLAGALVLAVLVLAVAIQAFRWARRPAVD